MAAPPAPAPPIAATARRLRVLFLATRDRHHPATTGGDNTMWENARYLASTGHDVTFVAAGHRGAAKEEVCEGMHVVRLRGIHSLWLTTFAYYVARCRGRFDVVVVEGFGGSRIPRLAPLYVREPIVTEWHQIHRELFAVQYPGLLNGPLNLLERLAVRVHRDTLVRAGTDDWRVRFEQAGFRAGRVFVLPVSIPDELLAAAATGEPEARPRILWLGKLRRYKCPDHLVRAMPDVLAEVPDAELTIAGRSDDSGYAQELARLARSLGVAERVHFAWDLSEEAKLELIRRSRVLAVTSAVEGFGIVVLEANAFGVPVVASTGVPAGAVQHGFNGLRYPFGNVAELASAVSLLLGDPELYGALSANGRSNAARFAWSRVGAAFERVVAGAAASQPSRQATAR
jgi:glycosyltransferase involved in cell wall biosynthesis